MTRLPMLGHSGRGANHQQAHPDRSGKMNEPTSAMRLPGAELRRFGHVCAFFHSREEEYRVLLPLAKEGFEQGEKVFHIVDAENRPERMRRLEGIGISPAAA